MIDLLALERMAQDFDQDPCGSGGRKGRGDLRKPSNQCVLGIRQRHGQEKWCFYRNLTFENGLRQEMMPLVGGGSFGFSKLQIHAAAADCEPHRKPVNQIYD